MLATMVMMSLMVAPEVNGVPAKRLAVLETGINSSHWLAQSFEGYDQAHFDSYMRAQDFDLIRDMGFKHVRLTVNPLMLTGGNRKPSSKLDPGGMAVLDKAIKEFTSRGVAVIVDIHPDDDYKEVLKNEKGATDEFVAFWGNLAGRLKGTNPDMVLLEILNEPNFLKGEEWRYVQGKALQAIRKAAPNHTIIVNPGEWSSVAQIVEMRPYSTKNMIYTFHQYEPFVFTHQGAEWGWDKTRFMKKVPYPSTPEKVSAMLGTVDDDVARGALVDYGNKRWNRQSMDLFIGQAAMWGETHGVPVYCGEFGAYRAFSEPEDRLAWLKDSVDAFEKHDIGWAMWDYAGGFSVVNGDPGARSVDTSTLTALGLKRR